MKKLLIYFIVLLPILLCSCGKKPHEKVVDNIVNLTKHDAIVSESEYDDYVSNLDTWATSEAYDELVTLPDSLRTISDENEEEYSLETEVFIDTMNIYACFDDIDLEEFSNFYLFDSEEYLVNAEGGEGDEPSSAWDDKLAEWFNPNKEHDVTKAKCFIGYGYYTLKFGGVEYRYYLAVKCNSEGKVEKFINNYLGTM